MKHFNLSSRSARAKLKPRTAPYYSRVRVGRSLGYRRLPGSQIGRWQLRYRDERGNYVVGSVSQADDLVTGQNSLAAMTYEEAFSHVQRFDPVAAKAKPAVLATVSQACDHYVKLVVLPNHKNPSHYISTIENHIKPNIGETPVADLRPSTVAELLVRWAAQPRLKSGKVPTSPDDKRSARSSANRWLRVLSAILTRAYDDDLLDPEANPKHWKTKPLQKTHRAGRPNRKPYGNREDMRELLRVTDPANGFYCQDFRKLLKSAMLTGRRFGDLTKMRKLDFDAEAGTISFSQTKTDDHETGYLGPEAVQWFLRITAELEDDDLILTRLKYSRHGPRRGPDGKATRYSWSNAQINYRMNKASKLAGISGGGINFYAATRHSYAVNWLNAGGRSDVLSKQMGHKSESMVKLHYGHIGDHQRRTQATQYSPMLEDEDTGNVTPITQGRKAS